VEGVTDLKVLHQHGLSHHQTGPLSTAGYATVEAVAELVDAHRATAAASALSQIPGFGGRRVALVIDAIDSWRTL